MSVQHISDQRRAFEAALTIAKEHPELPAAYVLHNGWGEQLYVQLETLSAWEAWREALDAEPSDVEGLSLRPNDLMLSLDIEVAGYPVHVYVLDQVRSALAPEVSA